MVKKRSSSGKSPIRILLVDDHREMAQTLADILKLESGFHVIGLAGNGLQAVALALKLHPDIILMNYSMPVMDGIGATRRITQQYPDAVIIMVSFNDDPSLIEASFKAGASGYIVKPITVFEELYSTLRLAYQMRAARKLVREARKPRVARPAPEGQLVTSR